MSILTGHLFSVGVGASVVPMLGQFHLSLNSDAEATVDSGSSGGNYRPCGNADWEVEWIAKGGTPLVFPNDRFIWAGSLSTTGKRAYGYMRCKQIEINVRGSEAGAYVWHKVTCGGAPTAAGEVLLFDSTNLSDAAVPAPVCASGLGVKLDDVAEANIEWSRLIINSDFERFMDTGLAGWYQRSTGNIDWAFSYRRKFADWTELPTVDSIHNVKQYVSSNTYWDLQWGRFTRPIDAVCDRSDKKPLAATVIAEMHGAYGTSLGYIKNPAVATKWPA